MTNAPQDRPRSVQTVRGMMLSLLALAVLVLLVTGLSGQCSFSPGSFSPGSFNPCGPDTWGATVPTVDADAELAGMARLTGLPLRVPQLSPRWRSNSANLSRLGEAPDAPYAARIGWLPPQGGYLRLSQSSGGERELVFFEVGDQRTAPGQVQVGGRTWTVYTGPRDEPAWVTDLGDVRVLITGSANEPEFRTLATAVLDAPTA